VRRTLLLLGALSLLAARDAAALPDLVPEVFGFEVVREDVANADFVEGCAGGETDRLLLRFSLRGRNLGPDDLYMGEHGCPDCVDNPGASCLNPLFVCSTAHGHVHFETFARTELLSPEGVVVAEGRKLSFCLQDSECTPPATPQYDCGEQGISAGCADIYHGNLPCQYLDVTDVSLLHGVHTLRVTLDPDDQIDEADESNNVVTAQVAIDCVAAGTCEVIDDFLCSTVATTRGAGTFVPVTDLTLEGAFGDSTVTATRRLSLCAPAAPAGSSVLDATTALAGYGTRRRAGSPPAAQPLGLEVVNRLGSVVLDLAKPDSLSVPTSFSSAAAPAPPDAADHALDALECRRARRSPGSPPFLPQVLALDDAFTGLGRSFVVRRPRRLCSPASLAGEALDNPANHLLCYDAAPAAGAPRPTVPGLFVANALESARVDVKPRFEVCVQSMIGALDGDLCGDARSLDVPGGEEHDTSFAGRAHDDPVLSCGAGGRQEHSVWYRLTAPGDGTITVDSFGSEYDSVLAAFSGVCGALTQLACDDDTQGAQSRISFAAEAGASYLVELASYGSSPGGAAVVTATFAP